MTTKKKKAPKLEAIFSQEIELAQIQSEEVAKVIEEKTDKVFKGDSKNDNKKIQKISTTIYIPLPVKDKLEEIQFSERKSGKNQNDLILEGIDFLLKDRGFPSIDQLIKEG